MPDDPTRNDKWMRQVCAECGFTRASHRCQPGDERCPLRSFDKQWRWRDTRWTPTGRFSDAE